MKESEARRGAIQWTLDLLSIQNYVIMKGRHHGHRFGKTKEHKDHHIAHNLRKRCKKRGFEGIHDRFLKDPEFLNLNSKLIELKKSVSRWTSLQAEYFRYNWWISLNIAGRSVPLKDRSDFNDALTTLNRLHQESGEEQLRPVPFWKYQHWHQSSSSSSSWWQWSDSWWS